MTGFKSIKKYLLGCFEISLFMRSGINYFNNNIKTMWQSFGIVFLTLIFTITSVPYIYEVKESLQVLSLNFITLLFVIKSILSYVLIASLIYIFCKIFDKTHNFIKYITTSNWASIIPLLLFIPILILMKIGNGTYDEFYPAMVVISVYTYILSAFIIRYIIDIPWELAAFITICIMAINEFFYKLLYYIASL